MEIQVRTGSESHTTWGAKGQVFVGPNQTPIYKFAKPLEQEWEKDRHQSWCEAAYEIPDGTLLKLYAVETKGAYPHSGGGAFFVADATAPEVFCYGGYYGQNKLGGGWIRGRVRRITTEQAKALGVQIERQYLKYYSEENVKVEAF